MRKTNHFKRPYKWVVVMLLMMASVNFMGFASAPKNVTIKVDGQTIPLSTRAMTVEGALEEAGVVLQKADGYEVVDGSRLDEGATIEVVRAMPIKVWKAGRTTDYTIGRKTVRDVLNAVDVDYTGYQVYPALDTEARANMTIHVISPTNQISTEIQDIPFEVELRDNDDLPRGRRNVVSPGQNGQLKVTYRTVQIGDSEIKKELHQEVVAEPKAEVVEIGTGRNLNMISFRPQRGSFCVYAGRGQRYGPDLHGCGTLSWGCRRGPGCDPLWDPDVHSRLWLCRSSGLWRRYQWKQDRPVHGRLWRCHPLGTP